MTLAASRNPALKPWATCWWACFFEDWHRQRRVQVSDHPGRKTDQKTRRSFTTLLCSFYIESPLFTVFETGPIHVPLSFCNFVAAGKFSQRTQPGWTRDLLSLLFGDVPCLTARQAIDTQVLPHPRIAVIRLGPVYSLETLADGACILMPSSKNLSVFSCQGFGNRNGKSGQYRGEFSY